MEVDFIINIPLQDFIKFYKRYKHKKILENYYLGFS